MYWFLFMYFVIDWLALYIILMNDIYIMILSVILMARHDPVITFLCVYF